VLKRQDLVLKALAKTRRPVRVKFAGTSEAPGYLVELQRTTAKLGIEDRVDWQGGVSDPEKYDLYARCTGVVYPPLNEDLGYVTLESMIAAKPLITCSDSGGPLEFIDDRVNGIVCEPRPEALAAAMDELWENRSMAIRFGEAGRQKYSDAKISWPHVVERLLNGAERSV